MKQGITNLFNEIKKAHFIETQFEAAIDTISANHDTAENVASEMSHAPKENAVFDLRV